MNVEKILLRFILALLSIAIVLPILILIFVKDKGLAGQIGDTLGGTSAPLVNISAILAVVATYYYQRRNDQKNVRRELIGRNFTLLREELNGINHVVTVTRKDIKEIKNHIGKDAISYIIRAINNNEYSHLDVRELVTFGPILNVYKYLNLLIEDVQDDRVLSGLDKELLLTQFSLFYRNNLFIDKEQRGDEVCKHHNVKHEIPKELYDLLLSIEGKLK
jgi:hypothetical protein